MYLICLDEIHTVFQNNVKDNKYFAKALRSSQMERNIGIGVMGFHSYLQKKNIPFESAVAIGTNKRIFKRLKMNVEAHQQSLPKEENCILANELGIKRRNILVTAIAPTMSISLLSGVTSAGIEPLLANSFIKKTNNTNFVLRNKYLQKIMDDFTINPNFDKQDWIERQWESINANEGSVQHLEWLDDYSKEVFKTAYEIDQNWLIRHAADRTEFIDQGQSLNLFMYSPINWKDLHALHMNAWKLGLKSLYYLRSTAPERAQTTKVKELGDDECIGCS